MNVGKLFNNFHEKGQDLEDNFLEENVHTSSNFRIDRDLAESMMQIRFDKKKKMLSRTVVGSCEELTKVREEIHTKAKENWLKNKHPPPKKKPSMIHLMLQEEEITPKRKVSTIHLTQNNII